MSVLRWVPSASLAAPGELVVQEEHIGMEESVVKEETVEQKAGEQSETNFIKTSA